jgi:DNA-binding beta-propeller fold protein YncE
MKQAVCALIFAAFAGFGSYVIAADECPPVGGLNFICGPAGAEDLVQVPGTHWIVGSGMSERNNPGRLHLIDADKKTWEILYPGANPKNGLDAKSYSLCPGAPDPKTFGAHGIAIRDDGNRSATILAVNHGREAIEVFKLDSAGTKPAIQWVGCVPMEKTVSLNSVAFLPGGGFIATKFYDPTAPNGFGDMMAHKITGGVLKWQSGTGVKPIAGTELSGDNGIEVSKDGKTLYVAAWGSQELARFSNIDGAVQKTVVKVDFSPDNLRWAPDGKILVTGQNAGFKGWTVAKLDPETMKITEILKDNGTSPLQNASVAIEVDGVLWIGPFSGNRVAYR